MIRNAVNSESPAAGLRPKRRWWVYAGIGAGVIFIMVVAGGVGIAIYWRSLVRDYTATQPQPLPPARATDLDFAALYVRWLPFQEAVVNGTTPQPFHASAAELNQLMARNPGLKDRVRLVITNNQVFGQFSWPLDQAKQRGLKGRYLNGLARLNLDFHDGWLTVTVADLKANDKPIPRWILKRLQKQNLAKDLDKNQEITAFLHQLDTIAVEDDQIVLKPR